jgi:hypothetical protein
MGKTLAEVLRTAEEVRLSQIESIRDEVEKVAKTSNSVHLDLMYLLDWAVNRASESTIEGFVRCRPQFDAMDPPLAGSERTDAIESIRRWSGLLQSYCGSLVYGLEINVALECARSDADIAFRQLSPDERPSELDPFAFQDFYLAVFRCNRMGFVLENILKDMSNAERANVGRIRERLNPHQQLHVPVLKGASL